MPDDKATMKLQAAVSFDAPVGDKADANYGYKWQVQVIKFGPGVDGRINWAREPLVAALPLFDKSRVFMFSESQHDDPANPKKFGKPVRDLVGWLSNPQVSGDAIIADFDILTSATKLRSDLLDSFDRGNPGFLGLSVDIDALTATKMIDGKKMKEPVKIVGVETDVVYDPTNEGKFIKMVAAVESDADQNKEEGMYKTLLASMRKQWPHLTAAIGELEAKGNSVTPAEVEALLASVQTQSAMSGASTDEARGILEQAKLMASAMTLNSELSGSGLPALSREKVKKDFDGKVFDVSALTAAITSEKEYLDKLTASGFMVPGTGDVKDVQGESERLQAAFDKTFGVKVDAKYDIAPFDGLRAAYVRMTGDSDVRGVLPRERLTAAFQSDTFTYVLGNTLYRRMVQDYKEVPDYGASLVISNKRNAKDFRTMESVRIAYYGDLPDVNPEVADYADLGVLSDEEVSYAINQKGGIVTITRKMIINDDMSAVSKIISRVPRAARRTLAKRIWNKFIANATYKGDSKAVFHADHGNLGSVALSTTSLLAAKVAMEKQTEPGSGERLNLKLKTLVLPTDLWGAATTINKTTGQPGTATFGNSFYQYFGANDENIFVCPFMTDATDWLAFGDPGEAEIIEVAFLNGQEVPEMFVADNPAVGQVFVADKIQYKIRHEYEAEILDYRNAYKAVVAG